jgi:hypothetical protein
VTRPPEGHHIGIDSPANHHTCFDYR